ncbi:potassium channel family protein [Paraburkholderia sp. EG285A]|uniref:potassium channel family protein n=1 Tax=Paraburkholderia sp. EG285A TaxID=3237009 RepID=UPI0034D1D9C1
MNLERLLGSLRKSALSIATLVAPMVAGFFVVHLSYSLLSPRSDAILDGALMFLLAALVLMTSRRMYLLVQLAALGLLLSMTVWTYSDIYMRIGIVEGASTVVHDRESALYFSIITFTTVGYGDYHPTLDGRMVAATEALTGYVFFGVFISMLSTYIAVHNVRAIRGGNP